MLPDRLELSYNGVDIDVDDGRLVCLNDMWKAAGSPPNKDPRQYKRYGGIELADALATWTGVDRAHIWKSKRGRHLSGVWAHWQVAIGYAEYLSPQFHLYVIEAFRQWAEEKADPGLKLDRAIEAYRKQGKSEDWIKARLNGKANRRYFTDQLQAHGVVAEGYALCTNALYVPAIGAEAKQLRERRGVVRKSAATRDALSSAELAAVAFAEMCATIMIDKRDVRGNAECVGCCKEAGSAAFEAIDKLGLRA